MRDNASLYNETHVRRGAQLTTWRVTAWSRGHVIMWSGSSPCNDPGQSGKFASRINREVKEKSWLVQERPWFSFIIGSRGEGIGKLLLLAQWVHSWVNGSRNWDSCIIIIFCCCCCCWLLTQGLMKCCPTRQLISSDQSELAKFCN